MIKLTFNTVTVHRPERFGVCAALNKLRVTSYKLTTVEIAIFGYKIYSSSYQAPETERLR